MRIYLDSNVFIAFILCESGGLNKLMYVEAEDFFYRCHKKHTLVLSNHAVNEIRKFTYYPKDEILSFFKSQEIEIDFIDEDKKDIELAEIFLKRGIHFTDALHTAIAINAKCAALVTFNTKDFEKIYEINVKEPVELF